MLWALAAASVVVWGLRWLPRASMAAPTTPQAMPAPDAQAIARVLGAGSTAAAAAPAAASRFVLLGVLAGKNGDSGAALIAIDGKSAHTFRIGAAVEGDWVLQSVGPHGVELGVSGAAPSVSLAFPRQP